MTSVRSVTRSKMVRGLARQRYRRRRRCSEMAKLFIIAGPNGAGKSTSAPGLLSGMRRVDEFVNADVIADQKQLSDLAAARATLQRLDELASARRDIAFETTLSSRSLLARIEAMQNVGYRCHVTFLWLPSADMAIQRVAQRVASGGHDIPQDVIRRRYHRGLQNFFAGYAAAVDSWIMLDNAARDAQRRIAWRVGGVLRVDDNRLWNQLVSRYMKPRAEEPIAGQRVSAKSEEDIAWNKACDPDDILSAVRQAVEEALARHKARGEPIVVWREGKVVWLEPDEY